ncbi:hypothetical protein O3M35_002969 [Rhynocoris fuscipes]|uniref:Mitochondrial pyruvate carrier n=1 Tax=Rhynocoris fuscipes TaxID=488301 RepID=A0AAW1CHE9_9HEMI
MSKLYHGIMSVLDRFVPQKLQPLWQHPAGPKTVFFWAPTFKWGLVLAALGDLQRPPENLSFNQTVSLTATGMLWSRYSLVIIPKNWNLFAVNAFVASTGLYQLWRIMKYRSEHPA